MFSFLYYQAIHFFSQVTYYTLCWPTTMIILCFNSKYWNEVINKFKVCLNLCIITAAYVLKYSIACADGITLVVFFPNTFAGFTPLLEDSIFTWRALILIASSFLLTCASSACEQPTTIYAVKNRLFVLWSCESILSNELVQLSHQPVTARCWSMALSSRNEEYGIQSPTFSSLPIYVWSLSGTFNFEAISRVDIGFQFVAHTLKSSIIRLSRVKRRLFPGGWKIAPSFSLQLGTLTGSEFTAVLCSTLKWAGNF